MNIKYFDDFEGTWNDVSGSTGSTLVLNDDGEWTTSVGYKKWVALLSQSGTSAPTAIVLENTLGVTLNLFYSGIGRYDIGDDNIFTIDKTFVLINNTSTGYVISTELMSDDAVRVHTITSDTLDPTNDILDNTSIEIRIYN